MEASDLALFAQSLRQATTRHSGTELDDALAEIGWLDALAVDANAAISTLFPLLGSAHSTSTALERVIGARMSAFPTSARMLLPALGGCDPPGDGTGPSLTINGILMGPVEDESGLLVAATTDGGGVGCALVPASLLQLREIGGIDPRACLVEVSGVLAPCPELGVTPREDWDAAVGLGQIAVGHQIVGTARAMLGLARDHAVDRVQFGQPIARFQALRHRLAETLVAIEGAEALLAAAGESPSPFLAANAKAVAGRAGRTATRHCQQVLAGIGYTAEHEFHHYMRRAIALDGLLGSTSRLTQDVGRQLISNRLLPDLLPL